MHCERFLLGSFLILYPLFPQRISDSQLCFSSAFLSGPLLPPPPGGDVINRRPLGLEPGGFGLGLGLVTSGLGLGLAL